MVWNDIKELHTNNRLKKIVISQEKVEVYCVNLNDKLNSGE